jgi:hypothetical protein
VKHKRDFERVSKELKALREENQHLKAVQKPDNNKVVLVRFICTSNIDLKLNFSPILQETSQLSDHLDCEICTCRMWTPYMCVFIIIYSIRVAHLTEL